MIHLQLVFKVKAKNFRKLKAKRYPRGHKSKAAIFCARVWKFLWNLWPHTKLDACWLEDRYFTSCVSWPFILHASLVNSFKLNYQFPPCLYYIYEWPHKAPLEHLFFNLFYCCCSLAGLPLFISGWVQTNETNAPNVFLMTKTRAAGERSINTPHTSM